MDEEESSSWSTAGQSQLDYLDQLKQRAMQSGSAAYGQNAAARWSGTPGYGLSALKGRQDRRPTFNARGDVRGYRSAPGAPQAAPQDGLLGGRALEAAGHGVTGMGASLTPNDQWRATFPSSHSAPRPDIPGTKVGTSGVIVNGPTPAGPVGRNLYSGYGGGYAY